MKKYDSIKVMSTVLIISGVFDLFGSLYFLLLVGENKTITNPPTHGFYSILIAIFLISLAILHFITASNVMHYFRNILVISISRLLYAVLFFSFLLFTKDFTLTFMPTAIADILWVLIYIVIISLSNKMRLKGLICQN